MKKIHVIASRNIFNGDFSVREDKFLLGKKIITKQIVEHRPSVGIIPIMDTGEIILVSQYRHASAKTLLEIPAGKIENGETPYQAALREMAEEIGYSGKLTKILHCYMAPGYDTEHMHIFVATDLKKIKFQNRDDDENISIKKVRPRWLVKNCVDGKIQDCKTVAAIMVFNSIPSKIKNVRGKKSRR